MRLLTWLGEETAISWINGDTPASVQRAAPYGDGWLPFNWDLDAFRDGVSLLQDLTRERGYSTMANELCFRVQKPDEPTTVRSTTPWKPKNFAGSADAVARHFEAYRQTGLEYALCAFACENVDDLLRQIRLCTERVAPQFADAG